MKAVIDTSLILGMYIENNSAAFGFLTSLDTLFITNLTLFETANGLRFNHIDINKASEVINELYSTPFKIIEIGPIPLSNSIKIASLNNTSVYDASYHTVALSMGIDLATMDKKYYRKSNHLGCLKLIE